MTLYGSRCYLIIPSSYRGEWASLGGNLLSRAVTKSSWTCQWDLCQNWLLGSHNLKLQCPGRVWAKLVEIQVFPSPTGYMFSGFNFFDDFKSLLQTFLWNEQRYDFKPWTRTSYFSNSTCSSVTSKLDLPIRDSEKLEEVKLHGMIATLRARKRQDGCKSPS